MASSSLRSFSEKPRRIALDLGEEADLVLAQVQRRHVLADGLIGEELRQLQIQRYAIFCSVSSDGTVCPFSTRDR